MQNFWTKLNKPFFCLAPMADVTDAAFRTVISKYGKPDVMWTEFVSADGLMSAGRNILLRDLEYNENERPIVAQLFSSNPDKMEGAAALVQELGFDGLDINMGCPDKTIEKQCSGAAMIKNPKLAIDIIRAAKRGAPNLPISVKTRLGYNKIEIESWLPELLKEDLAALTVHLRTRKEMSLVPAQWEIMPKIVEMRDRLAPNTLIIGNGDVTDLEDARKKSEVSGCDGVMLGRAIFGNPWLFSAKEHFPKSMNNFLLKIFSARASRAVQGSSKYVPSLKEKLLVLIEHTNLFEEKFKGFKSFAVMKKHYKAYVNGFDGAKELRVKLMETENAGEVEKIIKDFLVDNKI